MGTQYLSKIYIFGTKLLKILKQKCVSKEYLREWQMQPF